MLAQQPGLEVGAFVGVEGDGHLYSHHIEQENLQLSREVFEWPQLKMQAQVSSLFDYQYDDFEFVDYQPHAGIKAVVAT